MLPDDETLMTDDRADRSPPAIQNPTRRITYDTEDRPRWNPLTNGSVAKQNPLGHITERHLNRRISNRRGLERFDELVSLLGRNRFCEQLRSPAR